MRRALSCSVLARCLGAAGLTGASLYVRAFGFGELFWRSLPMPSRNPCGDLASYAEAPAVGVTSVGSIMPPVPVVQASRDRLFPATSGRGKARRFTHAKRVTFKTLPRTAHALTFEAGRHALEGAVDRWLTRSGL